MGSYKIIFKPSIEKDLRAIPKALVSRITKRIEGLSSNPLPPQSQKLASTEKLYRIRAGQYRIVYEFDAEIGQVTIHYVRHRREVYRRIT